MVSVQYANATITVNYMVSIVKDEVPWYDYYNDLRLYVESYVEKCSITSKQYV